MMQNILKFEPVKVRVILRQSTNGKIILAEDMNANFVLVNDNIQVGIYERKDDAIREYGRLTRASM